MYHDTRRVRASGTSHDLLTKCITTVHVRRQRASHDLLTKYIMPQNKYRYNGMKWHIVILIELYFITNLSCLEKLSVLYFFSARELL